MPDSPSRQLRLEGREREEVSLIFRYEPLMVKHYCMFCDFRSPIFVLQGRVYGVIYGHHVEPKGAAITMSIPCPHCGSYYYLRALSQ